MPNTRFMAAGLVAALALHTTSARADPLGSAPSSRAEPPKSPPPSEPLVDPTAGLATGIALIAVGATAAAGAGFYALGRLPYDEVDEQHGPGGGTLVAIGAIGVAGLAIGITLSVLAVSPPKDQARKRPALRERSGWELTANGVAVRF